MANVIVKILPEAYSTLSLESCRDLSLALRAATAELLHEDISGVEVNWEVPVYSDNADLIAVIVEYSTGGSIPEISESDIASLESRILNLLDKYPTLPTGHYSVWRRPISGGDYKGVNIYH